ncbi:MAG: DUF4065 domain-containing protein [Gammaproteobacteria bacterium]|nr:DUF4065 domain-containing protein [Gammaproteobacteria bacterium]
MNTLTHDTIADFFIDFAQDHGDYLTNLKLQKLVYYAQAWNLALYDKPLFDADFQAWVHGPVCPALYTRFKKYRWNPITIRPETATLPDDVKAHLVNVFEAYEQYSGYQLEQMTHAEAPWVDARKGIPLDEASTAVISKQSMKDFYSKLASE